MFLSACIDATSYSLVFTDFPSHAHTHSGREEMEGRGGGVGDPTQTQVMT